MKSGCCESESILSQILLLDVLLLQLLMRFYFIAKNESSNMQLFVCGFLTELMLIQSLVKESSYIKDFRIFIFLHLYLCSSQVLYNKTEVKLSSTSFSK